jgi:hypothetical protein
LGEHGLSLGSVRQLLRSTTPASKIPRLAVRVNRLYVGLNKRNFTKSLCLDEAALGRDRLRKDSTVLKFYLNKLVAEVFHIILF